MENRARDEEKQAREEEQEIDPIFTSSVLLFIGLFVIVTLVLLDKRRVIKLPRWLRRWLCFRMFYTQEEID